MTEYQSSKKNKAERRRTAYQSGQLTRVVAAVRPGYGVIHRLGREIRWRDEVERTVSQCQAVELAVSTIAVAVSKQTAEVPSASIDTRFTTIVRKVNATNY